MANSQITKRYQLNSGWTSTLPRTNSINDILVRKDSIWLGTEKGLSLTTNGGTSWTSFSNTGTFDNKGISAIAINENVLWVATGFSTKLNGESIQTGGGLHYSTDRGTTWFFIPQPVDIGTVDTLLYGNNKIRAMDVTVPQQNITFDIALTKKTVWTASWAGMLRKSSDLGKTWTRIILPPDNLDSIRPTDSLNYIFDLSPSAGRLGLSANNNHLLFSVYASDDSTIWVGTAGGINKSVDGGISWRKFSHQNQVHPISGNFVVALKEQRWNNRRMMWAATVNANDPDEIKGISFTEDGGSTWKTALLGEWVHNIAVNDSGSIVYVATDNGLFRSSDVGESWTKSGSLFDSQNLQRFVSSECYGVGVKGDTVWFAGPEGTAYTIDSPSHKFGSVWHIFRTAEQVSAKNTTYAFPNPFTPSGEPVRLHYSVTTGNSAGQDVSIRIFDYAMLPVRTLIQKAPRLSGKEYDEIWNGRNDNNSIVANGVYFYRIEIGDQSPLWGKILVLR
jgi:ligand-binding sensor domain-containing protein